MPTCTYVSSRRCLSRIARHVSVVISALRYLHNTSARQACRNTRAGMPGAPSLPPSTVPPPPNARSVPLPRHAILSHFRREWRTIVDLIRIPQAKVSNSLSLSLFGGTLAAGRYLQKAPITRRAAGGGRGSVGPSAEFNVTSFPRRARRAGRMPAVQLQCHGQHIDHHLHPPRRERDTQENMLRIMTQLRARVKVVRSRDNCHCFLVPKIKVLLCRSEVFISHLPARPNPGGASRAKSN